MPYYAIGVHNWTCLVYEALGHCTSCWGAWIQKSLTSKVLRRLKRSRCHVMFDMCLLTSEVLLRNGIFYSLTVPQLAFSHTVSPSMSNVSGGGCCLCATKNVWKPTRRHPASLPHQTAPQMQIIAQRARAMLKPILKTQWNNNVKTFSLTLSVWGWFLETANWLVSHTEKHIGKAPQPPTEMLSGWGYCI